MTTTRPTDLIKSSRAAELPVRVGVLLYDASIDVDAIIASAVTLMRSRGIAVAGLLQHFGEPLPNGKRSMWLEDIMTGTTLRLDRPRGPGATACILGSDSKLVQSGRTMVGILIKDVDHGPWSPACSV